MGFGASLALIAIGAIVAFATRFSLAGIDVQLIGWILMGAGVIGMIVTFAYTRPRRRGQVAEVIDKRTTTLDAHRPKGRRGHRALCSPERPVETRER